MCKKTQSIVNDNKRKYLDMMSVQHTNLVSMNPANSLAHEIKKAKLCYDLLSEGHVFVTEQKLKSPLRGRPDILILDVEPPEAYEIICSEREESIVCKKNNYGDIKIFTWRVEE